MSALKFFIGVIFGYCRPPITARPQQAHEADHRAVKIEYNSKSQFEARLT
jgi:hypothetical protein